MSGPTGDPSAPAVTEPDVRADLAARRALAEARRSQVPEPRRLPAARAVAGAALSIAGVCLGIATLLWVTDGTAPAPDAAVSAQAGAVDAAEPSAEASPDPVAEAPVPVAPVAPVVPVAPPSPATQAPPTVVPVTVLNNSRITGLADRAASQFRAGGWPVAATGNFRGRIPVTTVYFDPGLETSAQAIADSFDGIVRVRPRFDTLPARGVVVVLTRDFPA